MSPGESGVQHRKLPSICSYWVEGKPRKNLNQVTCPDRESNPGHLVSQPDALTVTPQSINANLKQTCMGPVPTQHRDALWELRYVEESGYESLLQRLGGIIVLTTRYLHSGWMFVHLCFSMWT
ncbi:hypothetical protein ANN_15475 [Periplaneta americana]|uniref:Uncharacterized protein n=1 Tax=Periplaneta americana TaxID=6978 RepID=A0ABQ8SHM0_PERAM|nr:hypothetical protein ANN_15475 [Periplaneta americana]